MRSLTLLGMSFCLVACALNEPKPQGTNAKKSEIVQRQLDLGIGYMRNGDYQRAKEKLNRALDIEPENGAVHATFGLIFQLEGEDKLAETYFINAIRFDPLSARVRNLYGAFLFAKKRDGEAIDQLLKASENRFYSNRPSVFENLGVAYNRVGDKSSAEAAFTRAVQLNPEQARALLELALLRFDERDYVTSRQYYRRHVAIAPKSPKALLLCTQLAKVFGQRDEEASCAEALEGIYPASSENLEYQSERREFGN